MRTLTHCAVVLVVLAGFVLVQYLQYGPDSGWSTAGYLGPAKIETNPEVGQMRASCSRCPDADRIELWINGRRLRSPGQNSLARNQVFRAVSSDWITVTRSRLGSVDSLASARAGDLWGGKGSVPYLWRSDQLITWAWLWPCSHLWLWLDIRLRLFILNCVLIILWL